MYFEGADTEPGLKLIENAQVRTIFLMITFIFHVYSDFNVLLNCPFELRTTNQKQLLLFDVLQK